MFLLAILLVFISTALIAYFGVPYLVTGVMAYNKSRAQKFAIEMDRTMLMEDIRKVQVFYILGPFIVGIAALVLMPEGLKIPGVVIGMIVGFLIPRFLASFLIGQRRQQFQDQLVDALTIMSSSFRGGLSLVQAMEAVTEEMPDPVRQELSVVLGENKIGVTMDEALNRLYRRMPSPSLQQVITAILLARETGGNLPLIFTRIVFTIREKRKLEENIQVLTIQGKLQSFVMSGLPVVFFVMVNGSNPDYFNVMTGTETGRFLLGLCIGLWVIGTFLIIKISSFKDF